MTRGKKGQELSTNTIIIIILAVVVLVVLAVGFTIGWQKLLPFTSQPNVDTIKIACGTACSTESTFDYCSVPRQLKNGTDTITDTCSGFSSKPEYSSYGIEACGTVTCAS